jgi:hypothetical protein
MAGTQLRAASNHRMDLRTRQGTDGVHVQADARSKLTGVERRLKINYAFGDADTINRLVDEYATGHNL